MRKLPSEIAATTAAALVLGAVSTFGDWLWAHYIPDGAVVPGIVHGVVIFLVIALVLAATARRGGDPAARRRLVWALPLAGGLIAASFYPLYLLLGYLGSLLLTWIAMWLVTAWLYGRARGGPAEARRLAPQVLARGALAALGSGLAFWAISGIWTEARPGGPDYLWHFACWSFAFLPGFAALFVLQKPLVLQKPHPS